jgi:hypothetical protein
VLSDSTGLDTSERLPDIVVTVKNIWEV